jgi:hypothetical protein
MCPYTHILDSKDDSKFVSTYLISCPLRYSKVIVCLTFKFRVHIRVQDAAVEKYSKDYSILVSTVAPPK